MSSIYIVQRKTVPGVQKRPITTRYHVRWQQDGTTEAVHLGVFGTKKLAQQKVDAAYALLAMGQIPTKNPVAPVVEPERTIRSICDQWIETRVDIAEKTLRNLTGWTRDVSDRFGDEYPTTITPEDVQAWIAEQLAHKPKPYASSTISQRLRTLAAVLDYAKVDPNPVRDRNVRKPKKPRKKPRLPKRSELALIYKHIDKRSLACLRLIEQTGMRSFEAVKVEYEHFDRRKHLLLVPVSKTSAGERWISQVDGEPPMPPKGTGRLFPGLVTVNLRQDMLGACKRARIRRYSPKDLRDLSASRLLHSGKLSPAEIAARLGHSSPAITLAVYSHVLPPEDD